MKFLKRLYSGYEKRMIRVGNERARIVLLSQSDRVLSDLGFSRYLLESGVDAWPWAASKDTLPANHFESTLAIEERAIVELQSLTDVELQDLGISRGVIHDSVIQGRAGIEYDLKRKVA